MGGEMKGLTKAIQSGIVNENMTVFGVMDFDGLSTTVEQLQAAFTPNFYHTFAVKANSLLSVLIKLKSTGIGAEVASTGELDLALAAGLTTDQIIYDSPAKTRTDLRRCLREGVSVNLDNE